MAMATQASLFTPTLTAPKSSDSLSFPSVKPGKFTVTLRPIRAMAVEGNVEAPANEAPMGFTPPHPNWTRAPHHRFLVVAPEVYFERPKWRSSIRSLGSPLRCKFLICPLVVQP
ncbi:hypothetical protein CsSME_00020940 [Camellia sinensis var. sinensis]